MALHDNLEANEIVWLLDERIKTLKQSEKKLLNPKTGPFRVKSVSQDGQNAVLYLGEGKVRRFNVRLLQRYIAPMAGIYPTEGRGCAQGVPVEVIAHREKNGADEYLVRYLTSEGEVQEWNAWELVPPTLVRDFLHVLEYNPWLTRCHPGKKVDVWWPLAHKQYPGVITSAVGNLLRILYDDGEVGEAIVKENGTLEEAAEYDERNEAETRARNPRGGETNPEGRGRGRPKGAKNKPKDGPVEPKVKRARKGRGLIQEAEEESRRTAAG